MDFRRLGRIELEYDKLRSQNDADLEAHAKAMEEIQAIREAELKKAMDKHNEFKQKQAEEMEELWAAPRWSCTSSQHGAP